MGIVRAKPPQADVNIAGIACTKGIFVIRAFNDRRTREAVARRDVAEKRPARTLSRDFWQ